MKSSLAAQGIMENDKWEYIELKCFFTGKEGNNGVKR